MRGFNACFLAALWIYTAFFTVLYAYAVMQMLPSPYPLEVYETSNFLQSLQFLKTGQIYTAPDFHYQAMMYMPLYYYVTAAASLLLGPQLLAGRLVSLLATAAIVAVMYGWLRRENLPRAWSAAGGATLLALFFALGKWYHTVHCDMLMIALLWAGLYFLHFASRTRDMLLSGLLLALAVYTKQQALLVVAPLLLGMLLYDARRALTAGLMMTVIILPLVAFETLRSDGWFLYYTLEMPGSMPKRWFLWPWFFIQDLLIAQPVMVGFMVYFLVSVLRTRAPRSYDYIGLTIGCVLSAFLARLHIGGWVNVLIPMWVGISLMAVMGLRLLLDGRPKDRWLTAVLALTQCAFFYYPPSEVRISAEYVQAYHTLEQELAQETPPVFTDFPLLLSSSSVADPDYLRGFGFDIVQAHSTLRPDINENIIENMRVAFRDRAYNTILLQYPAQYGIETYYTLSRTLYGKIPYPIGLDFLPRFVYVPK